MCGRIIQASPPDLLALRIVSGIEDRDNRVPAGTNSPPRYNGAPSQQHWVIRRNCQTGECSLELLQWGLIPNWCKDPEGYRNGAALCRWTGWHCVPAPRRREKER